MSAETPSSVLGVPCASVSSLGIDRQENLRAGLIMIGCGLASPGEIGEGAELGAEGTPESDGESNIDLITGHEIRPHVTQSESMVWGSTDGMTIIVNYDDSRDILGSPRGISGMSVSTDGGATFQRILPSPLNTGHGFNAGDPIVVYDDRLSTWFAGDLAGGCGGQGIGIWSADATDPLTWVPRTCAHTGNNDDRESMWVDNNPGSPFYGRMYVSWNNFSLGARLFATHSDDGTTWSAPVPLSSGFIRDMQITGSPGDDGTVFVAGMNENGGGGNNRTNIMYRSADGGDTWTAITMGPPFPPPGQFVPLCGTFFWAIPRDEKGNRRMTRGRKNTRGTSRAFGTSGLFVLPRCGQRGPRALP